MKDQNLRSFLPSVRNVLADFTPVTLDSTFFTCKCFMDKSRKKTKTQTCSSIGTSPFPVVHIYLESPQTGREIHQLLQRLWDVDSDSTGLTGIVTFTKGHQKEQNLDLRSFFGTMNLLGIDRNVMECHHWFVLLWGATTWNQL